MKLYQFLVPLHPNDGTRYPLLTHDKFYLHVEGLAGGFTRLDSVVGVWIDPKTKQRLVEEMEPMQVACVPAIKDAIVQEFRERFPDQKCIMVTTLGEVEFLNGSI